MCRWIAYSVSSVLLSRVLLQPGHSLVDQSLRPRTGAKTIKGDGFGSGPYPQDRETSDSAVLREVDSAWNDGNLQEAAHHTRSGPSFGRIGASTGTAAEQSSYGVVQPGGGMLDRFRPEYAEGTGSQG
ncbi:Class II glutamine amidotransferase OS=Streptomyces tendae OX=1932 GN=F3L20_12895 PE=4 SV=1 [Streptomyces tendae]